MIPWPKPTTGSSPIGVWLNRLLGRCQQEHLLESKDFRRVQTTGGYYLEPKFQIQKSSSAPPSPSKILFLGIIKLGSALNNPDLLICKKYNPPTKISQEYFGQELIYVAKQLQMRRGNTKEYFKDDTDNVTQSYTFFSGTASDETYGDNFRLATDGLTQELQVVVPRYIYVDVLTFRAIPVNQALIYAEDTGQPTGVYDPNGNPVTIIERPMREWARYISQ